MKGRKAGFVSASILIMVILTVSCNRNMIFVVSDNYTDWKKTTEVRLDYPIPGHENHFRQIFINPIGENAKKEEFSGRVQYTYPEGTIVIKEIYSGTSVDPGERPAQLTVMVKDSKSSKARGGWIWIVKQVKTGQEIIVENDFCVGCHEAANDIHPYGDLNPRGEFRDYLFFPYSSAVTK